jgi:Na+-driven multidrug efflux pump
VAGVWASARAGLPLLVRTLSLRAAILLTVVVATDLGDVALAGHQVVGAVWALTAFALDALAIAAQALVGRSLGAGDVGEVRAVLRRTLQWGTATGTGLGLVVAAGAWLLPGLFTPDAEVRAAITVGLLVAALFLPVAGWVFVLDGVLIGAGDGRYLAAAGMVTLVAYAPAAWAVGTWAPDGAVGLGWLWLSFAGVFMVARAVVTGVRARGTAWMVTGA